VVNNKIKLCLVCSSGGHFSELYFLQDFWSAYERFWVTFEREDTAIVLKKEAVYFAHSPTNRHPKNFLRNFVLAWKILRRERPSCVVSTGAGVAVPFIYVGKILRMKTIFIETLSRVEKMSLSGRLVYFPVDVFLAQWPELAGKHKKIAFRGQVI